MYFGALDPFLYQQEVQKDSKFSPVLIQETEIGGMSFAFGELKFGSPTDLSL
jgi:hypothetical protein